MVGLTEPSKDAMIRRPIGIDLFSGAGGLSLGFEQAGFDVVAAVEIDPIHAAIHKFNFPECTVIPRSVIGLSGRDIRRLANIGNRSVEVVLGGAPCQGFSLIGQRVLDDPRNALVREFVRIVHELNASYFVFENVKGLTVGKPQAISGRVNQCFARHRLPSAIALEGLERLQLWRTSRSSAPVPPRCKRGVVAARLSRCYDKACRFKNAFIRPAGGAFL